MARKIPKHSSELAISVDFFISIFFFNPFFPISRCDNEYAFIITSKNIIFRSTRLPSICSRNIWKLCILRKRNDGLFFRKGIVNRVPCCLPICANTTRKCTTILIWPYAKYAPVHWSPPKTTSATIRRYTQIPIIASNSICARYNSNIRANWKNTSSAISEWPDVEHFNTIQTNIFELCYVARALDPAQGRIVHVYVHILPESLSNEREHV